FFGAAGVVDAVGAGQRVHIFVVEIEIARELTELRGFGNSPEGVFGRDFRQFQRGLYHAVETFAREIARVGAGSALSEEDAHADGFRSRFLQGFDLAKANQGGEFVAFTDDAFGGGGATFHRAADDVLCEG